MKSSLMVEWSGMNDRKWATGAAILGFAMLALYVTIIVAEGGNSFWDVFPWALLIATAAVLAFASVQIGDPHVARNLLIGAAALYGVIGVASIFSIGFVFLLAAAAAAVGATRISSEKSS